MRKGSYFFVIDAFVASIIILGVIVVLFSDFSTENAQEQAFYAAEDFLRVLESTKVSDYDQELVRNWTQDGNITDSSRTLLQQLAHFNVTSNLSQARELANLTIASVPAHVNVRLLINGELYGWRDGSPASEASTFFSSKRILLLRKSPTDVYPAVIVEAQTWQ